MGLSLLRSKNWWVRYWPVSCSDTVLSLRLGIWILDQLVVLILNRGSHRIIELVNKPILTQQPNLLVSFPRNHPPGTSFLISFNNLKPEVVLFGDFFENWNLRLLAKFGLPHCCCTLPAMINYFIFFLCFSYDFQ
jgi:hypothetical protein